MTDPIPRPPAEALLAAFHQVDEAVFVTDPRGRILFANPAFETITGHAPDLVVGLTPSILKSGHHDADFYEGLWSTIQAGRVWRGTVVNQRKSGARYVAEASITPVRDAAGAVTHFVAVQRDVTTLRQTQKLEALGMITATIAHELNNPLSFLLLNIDIVQSVWEDASPLLEAHIAENPRTRLGRLPWDEVESTIPKLLSGMKTGAERLQQMCQELRTFTRNEERTPPHEFHLEQALEGALELLGPKLLAHGVQLEVVCAEELPPILGWPGELEQVLVNLLLNALEVVPEQGGRIDITADLVADHLEVVLRDNGPGIPIEDRHRIFEPFFTTRPDAGGTGLGLAISRRIVERMQGDLTLLDDDQPGAAFRLRLPNGDGSS